MKKQIFVLFMALSLLSTGLTASAVPRLFKQLKLKSSTDPGAYVENYDDSWRHIPGNQVSGYKLKLDGQAGTNFFIDIMSLKGSIPVGDYGFFLDVNSLPDGFYTYWQNKGVDEYSAFPWESVMWQIIDDDGPSLPICILRVNADGSYWLVDGLHNALGDDQTFRVPGDYPIGTYTVVCSDLDPAQIVVITFK